MKTICLGPTGTYQKALKEGKIGPRCNFKADCPCDACCEYRQDFIEFGHEYASRWWPKSTVPWWKPVWDLEARKIRYQHERIERREITRARDERWAKIFGAVFGVVFTLFWGLLMLVALIWLIKTIWYLV